MGLLDQVLGQVIGNMAGGGRGQPGAQGGGLNDILGQVLGGGSRPGGQGGAHQGGGMGDILGQILAGGARGQGGPGQAGGGIGDILGQVLGGGQAGGGAPQPSPQSPAGGGGPLGGALGSILGGAGGKLSPLVLAVLAVLASKHLSTGAGGLGSILHDMVSGGRKPAGGEPGGEAAPDGYEGAGPGGYAGGSGDGSEGEDAYGEPPEGAPPYPGPQGGSGGRMAGRGDGGFLDDVGSMLDGPGGPPRRAGGGGLGEILGGGFDDLQQRFDRNGQGGLMDSWIGPGANQAPAPGDLEQALGSGAIDQLARQFGMDRTELLEQLSRALPQVVDGLTPDGRLPTQQEQRGWV